MQVDSEQKEIYSVSQLNSEVRFLLEDTYQTVWVEGEISNFAAPHSGHWYFSLKDPSAQARCAMFRGNQRNLGFTPKDGMHVLLKARVSLYENRGEFQLIAEFMEERGEGKLRRAYELLKKKLEAAGLFEVAHKKPIPAFPTRIGVVTSATGAAIRDILIVLKRRYPCVPVILYPTLVQGATAAPAIVSAIQTANRRYECDVLIVARGGGSLEDLWPFNEESVAQAIYQSTIPIISGIGHEVDFTIADFVADKRAPTPSAAAEMATPDKNELLLQLKRLQQQLGRAMGQHVNTVKQRLDWIQKHLSQQHPKRQLMEKMQRLDFLELTLVQLQQRLLSRLQHACRDQHHRLQQQLPLQQIQSIQNKLSLQQQRLFSLMQAQFIKQQTAMIHAAGKLDGLSPLATLKRGYAIASDPQGHLLREANEVAVGDEIQVRLSKGSIDCTVKHLRLA